MVLLTCVYYFFISVKQNKEGKSPLHIAAMHGRFTGSQILIQNGNLAVKNSVVLFIPNPLQPKDAFLCHAGGEVDCVDMYECTPLHVAAKYGQELLISTLLTNGADKFRFVCFSYL